MERRSIILIISLTLVWTSWIGFQAYLASKRPPVAAKPVDEVPAPNADAPADGKDKPAERDDQAPKGDAKPPAEAAPDQVQPAIAAGPAAAPAVPRQWLALGSADPSSGYSGLYYFDNHGAAVERVELNGKQYKSVEDYSGYLGRLSLRTPDAGGAEVNVVGADTPAALAKSTGAVPPGLAVGDVIQTVDGLPVIDDLMMTGYLREKKQPGQSVVLGVIRKGFEKPIQFTAVLTRPPLDVVHPESRKYKLPNGREKRVPEDSPHDPLSLLLTLDAIGMRPTLKPDDREIVGLPSLYDSNWTVEQQGPDFIEFSFTLDEAALAAAKVEKAGPLKIVKRYSLTKAEKPGEVPYHLNLQITIKNLGEQSLPVAYRLIGPTGLPLEGWWYSTKLSPKMWTAAGARDVVYDQKGLAHQLIGCPKIVSDARQAEKDKRPPLSDLLIGDQAAPFGYFGVDTQFFASVIQPQEIAKDQPIRFREAFARPVQDLTWIPKTRLRTADVSVQLSTSKVTIEPGAELKHEYRVFFGPKDPRVLDRYGLDRLIEYGWPIFKFPAIWLRGVLKGLYWMTAVIGMPNYGIAIILLTVIVRTCMIPVSLKQARSAAKMQELAPEIQKIKDKYPDDPMKQHAAVQELYKKHDFNMFGGCLPVFIQLPIFIGLYRCLSVDIDLRDAALFPGFSWASNLAGPDKLFRWDTWMPAFLADDADGYLGPFFNVFPLITVTLFLIQQKMFTPPATDDQTKMQQQMMTYMTVFMGVMFYKVPAGLCIYFITSSLWGICERKLLPKSKPKDAGGGNVAKLPAKPTSPNGSAKPGSKRPKLKR